MAVADWSILKLACHIWNASLQLHGNSLGNFPSTVVFTSELYYISGVRTRIQKAANSPAIVGKTTKLNSSIKELNIKTTQRINIDVL